jgi:hypothetical protein
LFDTPKSDWKHTYRDKLSTHAIHFQHLDTPITFSIVKAYIIYRKGWGETRGVNFVKLGVGE